MQSKRLLLLTDDPFLAGFYVSKLEKVGFAVQTAESAKDALALLEEQPADLVVVDALLRDNSGTDAIESLRAQTAGSTVPILALPTAHYPLSQRVEELRRRAAAHQ